MPAPPASAHQLVVGAPGAVELDLGDAGLARLVHATLVRRADTIRVELSPGGAVAPLEALLLIPDRAPEDAAADRRRPRAWALVGEARVPFDAVAEQALRDDVTGLRYEVIGHLDLSTVLRRGRATATLVVERQAAPTRAALLVRRAGEAFAAEDPSGTPRTLAQLRAWDAMPAGGTAGDGIARAPRAAISWFAAALAIVAALVAGWWIRAGHARSRERGIERERAAR